VFLLRLASLVMRAWVNLTRYHGVFAPASPWRSRIVPKPPEAPISRKGASWIPWKALLEHAFMRIGDRCPDCGLPMQRMETLQGQGRAMPVLQWIHNFGWVADDPQRPP